VSRIVFCGSGEASVYARHVVWLFNVFATLDLLAAITLATILGELVFMGPAYHAEERQLLPHPAKCPTPRLSVSAHNGISFREINS
jgi:hypothetical protein